MTGRQARGFITRGGLALEQELREPKKAEKGSRGTSSLLDDDGISVAPQSGASVVGGVFGRRLITEANT